MAGKALANSKQSRNLKPTPYNGQARIEYPLAECRQRGIAEDAWRVLVNSIFPTARTPEAVLMAVDYCRVRRLDIFKKPVHIVPMYRSDVDAEVETVWPGISEVCTTASRTDAWAGMDKAEFGPKITRVFSGTVYDFDAGMDIEKEITVTYPEWVDVTVYRWVKGHRAPFCIRVWWEEAYGRRKRKSELPTEMWEKRAAGQLQKCGLAASLRAGFPEESGYVAEEMEGKELDDVPSNVHVLRFDAPNLADEKSKSIDQSLNAKPNCEGEISPEDVSEEVRNQVALWIERLRQTRAYRTAADYAYNRLQGRDYEYALQEIRRLRKELQPGNVPNAA